MREMVIWKKVLISIVLVLAFAMWKGFREQLGMNGFLWSAIVGAFCLGPLIAMWGSATVTRPSKMSQEADMKSISGVSATDSREVSSFREANATRTHAIGKNVVVGIGAAISITVVLVLAYYVWPTKYRYDHFSSHGSDYPIRTNRFSDETEIFRVNLGWVPVQKAVVKKPKEFEQTQQTVAEDVSQVESPRESGSARELVTYSEPEGRGNEPSMSREEAEKIVASTYPDFYEIRDDQKYADWLSKQPDDTVKLAHSSSPYDAIELITRYKRSQAGK